MEANKAVNFRILSDFWSNFLEKNYDQVHSIGVSNGLCGITIYFLYRYLKTGSKRDRLVIIRILQSISGKIEQGTFLHPVDMTELLYTLDICEDTLRPHINITSLRRDLQRAVKKIAFSLLDQQKYDPYTGGFFQAYYLLHQTSEVKLTSHCLDILKEKTKQVSSTSGYFDSLFVNDKLSLNITHGLAFYINYLCDVFSKGIRKRDCVFLVEQYFNFLFAQQHPFLEQYYFFDDYKGENTCSRLNLCYGDAGILFSLLKAACILENKRHQSNILRMLEQTLSRHTMATTGIRDDSLLYGSAGLYLFYQKIFGLTCQKQFCRAANYWKQNFIKSSFNRLQWYVDSEFEDIAQAKKDMSFQEGVTGALTAYECSSQKQLEALGFFFYLK